MNNNLAQFEQESLITNAIRLSAKRLSLHSTGELCAVKVARIVRRVVSP